ncbi:hypothetical protein [Methanocella sp. MCL-LM]|uniref:hypothetical protein n=1 Tax=Methanocella sp. MCL-LM TaxID=3412035 RepID=UPI003C7151B7
MGVITLDKPENSPYAPYIYKVLEILQNVIASINAKPDMKGDDMRIIVNNAINTVTDKALQKDIKGRLLGLNADHIREAKMIKAGLNPEDPEIEKKVEQVSLSKEDRDYAYKLALEDLLGVFSSEYLGKYYDANGFKKGVAICHIRNDRSILLPIKNLNKEDRDKLYIPNIERIIAEEAVINARE